MITLNILILTIGLFTVEQRSKLLDFFQAIEQVEGWRGGIGAAGEVGPFQITPNFYTDAVQQLEWEKRDTSQLKFRDLETDKPLCRRIVLAYFRRHCFYSLKTGDFRTLARVYNGGPSSLRNPKRAYNYWVKIRNKMK